MAGAAKLMFVVTEDWFFASHFLPLALAARRDGYDVTVQVRLRSDELRQVFEAAGLRVLPSAHRRGQFGPFKLFGHVIGYYRLFRRERPDIVHLISVRLIVLAGIAAALARVPVRVHAVTGLGFLATARATAPRLAGRLLGWLLRGPMAGEGAAFLFENREDPLRLGLPREGRATAIVGGAGIDPDRDTALPWPPGPVLKVAVVARMIRSKGIDLAVEAVRRARARGADIALTLVGAPDSHNPQSFTAAELEAWGAEPGIRWTGHSDDIRTVWRDHHVVCVPSRGGEGLPRALLEGAAAGRAVLTTLTAGCATFARDGVEGRVVPPGDAEALAEALGAMAADPDGTARMGQAARARVLDGFTTESVSRDILALYRRMRPDR